MAQIQSVTSKKDSHLISDCGGSGTKPPQSQCGIDQTPQLDKPTLLLIDHIEPAHAILHALITHNYFSVPLIKQGNTCVSARKVIVFLRRRYLFAFPVPCPMYMIARRKTVLQEEPEATTEHPREGRERNHSPPSRARISFAEDIAKEEKKSFSAIVGVVGVEPRRHVSIAAEKPSLRKATKKLPWTTNPYSCRQLTDNVCRDIIHELHHPARQLALDANAIGYSLWIPLSFEHSPTFCDLHMSRVTVERALAAFLVKQKMLPAFDMSHFPGLLREVAKCITLDFSISCVRICMTTCSSRVQLGNVLSIIAACQQWMVTTPLFATVTDALQFYFATNIACTSAASRNSLAFSPEEQAVAERPRQVTFGSDVVVQPSTPLKSLPGVGDCVSFLDLQDLVVEPISWFNTFVPTLASAAKRIVDARGTQISQDLLAKLVYGPTNQRSKSLSVLSPPEATLEDISNSSIGSMTSLTTAASFNSKALHPILLASDATSVGVVGLGYAADSTEVSSLKDTRSGILHCFLFEQVGDERFLRSCCEGLYALAVVERNKVRVQLNFSKDEAVANPPLWELQLNDVGVAHASIYSPRRETCDPGECLLALLMANGSCLVISLSRMPRGLPVSISQAQLATTGTLLDGAVAVLSAKTTLCEDPYQCAVSASFVAIAQQDADILVVTTHPFSSPLYEFSWKDVCVMQCQSAVAAIEILDDRILCAAIEAGDIQLFFLGEADPEKQNHIVNFHEARVNVVRCIPQNPFSATIGKDGSRPVLRTMFVSGSDDCTMGIFSAVDAKLCSAINCHSSPVIDISADCVLSSNALISVDKTGCVIVTSINPEDFEMRKRTLWSSTIASLRAIHASQDGSWLVCTRVTAAPLAIPIAEWCSSGFGVFHSKAVSAMHVSGCGRYLFTGGRDALIFVWDLENGGVQTLCYREHATGVDASIENISTATKSDAVISSDNIKSVLVWQRSDGQTIRILDRSHGIGSFISSLDYILLITATKGTKIFDRKFTLVSANSGFHPKCFDVYEVLEEDVAAFPYLDPPPPNISIARCLIGFGLQESESHYVGIYSFDDLTHAKFELKQGEIEDDDSDGESQVVSHGDEIQSFVFLHSGKGQQSFSQQHPSLTLAASEDDLMVVVWNWRKKEPLRVFEEASHVNFVRFFYSQDEELIRQAVKEEMKLQQASIQNQQASSQLLQQLSSQMQQATSQILLTNQVGAGGLVYLLIARDALTVYAIRQDKEKRPHGGCLGCSFSLQRPLLRKGVRSLI